jgi:hypothetical protein
MTNFSSISLLPVVLPLVFYAMTYDQLDCIMRWLGRTEDGTFEKKTRPELSGKGARIRDWDLNWD